MTRRFGGTGLGLAIVSNIVKKMGGDIRVRSKLGEGSTFSFNIPAEWDSEQEAKLGAKSVEISANRTFGMRVMIVAEERSETAISLREMLQSVSLESTVVGLGEEALGAIERSQAQGESFGLIMVDAHLGDMSGDHFVHMLVKNSELNAPVVLMLAGSASPDDIKKAWAAEPDWVLYKPVIQADLMETLERSLRMMVPTQNEPSKPVPAIKRSQGKPPLRVLIVEDNLINQIVAERILMSFGCDIVKANNGREAVDLLEHDPFDLVLMDIQMPEMDGVEATRVIRSFPDQRAQLPIVAMTAHAMKGDRERFLAAGMDHYISKPFHKDELLLLVKSIESRVRMTSSLASEIAPAEKSKGISLERFLKTMGGDEILFRGACQIFAELMPECLRELNMALREGRPRDAERLAHNLRGALDSVGARETSEMVTVMKAHLRSHDFPSAISLLKEIEADISEIMERIETLRHSGTVVG